MNLLETIEPILEAEPASAASDDLLVGMLEHCERQGIEPYGEQLDAFDAIAKGNSVVLNTPTGSGKSLAARCFEDLGFFCVDNLPVELIESFSGWVASRPGRRDRSAVVVDVRDEANLDALPPKGATLIVGVLPIKDGSQAQARVLAILP